MTHHSQPSRHFNARSGRVRLFILIPSCAYEPLRDHYDRNMANENRSNGEPTDPREAFEQLRSQMLQSLNKSLTDAFEVLQDVGSAIEQRLEEVFGSGDKSKGAKPGDGADVVDTTATKAAKKKVTPKKAPAKKKAAAKKAPAKKKAAAKKAPAKKKAAAKKAPAKKKAAAKNKAAASTGPTRDELYEEAKKLDIAGRSSMTKAQLQRAIKKAKG